MANGKLVVTAGIYLYQLPNGNLHREDGPAIAYSLGNAGWYREWAINGKRHRIEGPAIVDPARGNFYYLNGQKYSQEEWERARKMLWIL